LDEVLFANDAYDPTKGNFKAVLKLTGPRSVRVNEPVTLKVTDGATGNPVEGAKVSNETTDNQGQVKIKFTATGFYPLKADKEDFIRSNVLKMVVTAN
jgi:uncharacterized GH25 family protein